MGERVLITGGAGFIGSHVADELLAHGYTVRALDNLTPQVHAGQRPSGPVSQPAERPAYLHRDIELVVGDMRDPAIVTRALRDVGMVVHLAAAVGVGQSMYQIAHYTGTNTVGTAVLLEALATQPVQRLVVASSMSIYGEGLYADADGTLVTDAYRDLDCLRRGQWEPLGKTGAPLIPLPTPESKSPVLESVYALSKFDQERLCLIVGRAHGIDTIALRFFNVYGPRQSLSNPYTGVLAIFAARLLGRKPPLINEDGLQRRDFVSVRDVARACRLALERRNTGQETGMAPSIFNIGSGESISILEVAQRLNRALGAGIDPQITESYRVGDIRHCFADISLARSVLHYEPGVSFDAGVAELVEWLARQGDLAAALAARPSDAAVGVDADPVETAHAELVARGLSIPASRSAAARSAPPAPAETTTMPRAGGTGR